MLRSSLVNFSLRVLFHIHFQILSDPAQLSLRDSDPGPAAWNIGVAGASAVEDGYLILALDDRRYLDLAVNLALSICRCDTRPISVVVSTGLAPRPEEAALFDQVIPQDQSKPLKAR